MPCSSCRLALPPDARFCPACGTPNAPAPAATATEGRKMVTVLFCDLVGSTALSGTLDPETLRTVTLRYFELMGRQIESHGGTVEKFIGDAVMAVFGVPTVHEDDARRALAAALDMLDALATLNAELQLTLGVRLNVRIGVNTGQVVAGSDASTRQALVSGETVNVAARLEQNAPAGQILIGPDTLLSVGAAVRAEPVGPLLLKGKTDPVPAYRLLGLGEDDPELLRRFDVRFVGRRQELAALDQALEDAGRSRGVQRILVHGEAGQGKTRLLREWLQQTARPVLHGTGRCRPYGERGSLQPLADAVTSLLAAAGPGDPVGPGEQPEVTEALRVLSAGLLLDGTPNPSVEETCAALVRILAVLAVRRPVVLVVDDFHWAGPLLLDLLDRLVTELDRTAVLVVCLSRPEPSTPRREQPGVPSISLLLSGLSDDDASLLAAELVDVSAHLDSDPLRLLERAGGNPLHLEQLLAAGTEAPDGLPLSLQAVLGARIDALESGERTALNLASVIGREFVPGELAGLCGTDPARAADGVRDALLRLSRRRLVEPDRRSRPGQVAFRFSSGLVQEVTYACMSKRARAEGHEKAADLPSVRVAGPAAVGSHLERAHGYRSELGMLDAATEELRFRAAEELGRAGDQACARSDLPWAADLLARALALGRPDEPGTTAATRRLGEVRLALGSTDEGRALLRSVLAGSADPAETAHARLSLAIVDTDRESPADAAQAALPVFEAARDELGQARACLRLAQARQAQGRHGEAEGLLTRALAHAVRADGEPERAAALGAMGISLWRGPEPVPSALAQCRTLLAEQGRERRTVRVTLNCPLAVLLALHGEPDSARESLSEAGRLADELGYAEAEVFLPLFGAAVEALAGRPDRALDLLDGAQVAAHRLGATPLLGNIALESARILADSGRWSGAAAALDRAGSGAGRPRGEAVERDGLQGRIAAARGDRVLALEAATRAVRAAERTDSPVLRGCALLDLAHTHVLLADTAAAASVAALARTAFAAKGHRPGMRWAARMIRAASDGSERP
jgi:class 3 adenylate cyclase/tetratricopeptide (TPR) repeat protein